jgi:preprotein translocase subunit SecF
MKKVFVIVCILLAGGYYFDELALRELAEFAEQSDISAESETGTAAPIKVEQEKARIPVGRVPVYVDGNLVGYVFILQKNRVHRQDKQDYVFILQKNRVHRQDKQDKEVVVANPFVAGTPTEEFIKEVLGYDGRVSIGHP